MSCPSLRVLVFCVQLTSLQYVPTCSTKTRYALGVKLLFGYLTPPHPPLRSHDLPVNQPAWSTSLLLSHSSTNQCRALRPRFYSVFSKCRTPSRRTFHVEPAPR
uniref:Putative secreted protein n=1 Tax=Ixodes ricinus TaxID=34613 RepID=A0A6B0UCZ5_IXORI